MLKNKKQNLLSDIVIIPPILGDSYFPSLDGLRAVSILLVIISHIGMTYKLDFDFHPLADLGVQFFFVISGFLITSLLVREKVKTGHISLKNFYIRRVFRILPVAFMYLFIVLILNFILHLKLDYFLILASFLFLRNIFINSNGVNHLTTHYWSLSVEEQFYLIFPVILRKRISYYLCFLIFIIAYSLVIGFLNGNGITINNYIFNLISGLIIQFQGIAIGSLFSLLVFKQFISFEKLNNKAIATIFIFIAIFIAAYFRNFNNHLINGVECALFALILIINLTNQDNLVFKLLNSRIMKLIGILSYSLYIWQQPFTQNITFINNSNFIKRFDNIMLVDIFITIISMVALGVISYLSYYYYEKRFLKLKEKFR